MKVTLNRQDLAETLAWVAQVIPKKPQAVALGGVRLVLTETSMRLEATDYDTTHSAILEVLAGEPGEVLVPGLLFRDLAAATKGADVTLEADERELTLSAGRSSYRIQLLNPADFPVTLGIAPGAKKVNVGTFEAAGLKEALGVVSHLIEDDAADAVRGLHLELDGGLRMVAACSSAMAMALVPFVKKGTAGCDTNVPGAVIAKAIRGLSGSVAMRHSEGILELADAARTVTLRTYATKFIDWRQLMRETSNTTVSLNAAELADAAHRAALAAGDELGGLWLAFGDFGLQMTASTDGVSGLEHIDAEVAEPVTLALSARFLVPALATFAGGIQLGIDGPKKPVTLSDPEDPSRMHLVMVRSRA